MRKKRLSNERTKSGPAGRVLGYLAKISRYSIHRETFPAAIFSIPLDSAQQNRLPQFFRVSLKAFYITN